jgi:hypothetical protein
VFKAKRDTFSIDLEEFQHLFSLEEEVFVKWDEDKNLLVDAL